MDMLNPGDQPKGSEEEIAEAKAEHTDVEAIKARELARTGGRATENPIAELLDEGHVVGHEGGQIRGDQTTGHHGGSQRQGLNRGRD